MKKAVLHDLSKFSKFERKGFAKFTSKLHSATYGSKEYNDMMLAMKETLHHHYTHNNHHPEYYLDQIKQMQLSDIVEMYFDWLAATKRHDDGDVLKSIENNQKRFSMSEELSSILRNTSYAYNAKR